MRTYVPRDPSLPLILPRHVFRNGFQDPSSYFVKYVEELFSAGYTADTLHPCFVDLYALAKLQGRQEDMGIQDYVAYGNYLGKWGVSRDAEMECAARAARMIDLPEMADLIDRCRAFCRANPEMTDQKQGFEEQAAFLKELDREFDSRGVYMPEERESFFNSLPSGHCDDLSKQLHRPGAEAALTAIVAEIECLLPIESIEHVANLAAERARPFFEQRRAWIFRDDAYYLRNQRAVDVRVSNTAWLIKGILQNHPPEVRVERAVGGVRKSMMDEGLGALIKFSLHAAAWIAQHPNLALVDWEECRPRISEICERSPFLPEARQ